MEPGLMRMIVEELDRIVRREFYKVVKAWKRGYLLYGPPGTGKSSLIVATANYLKFDVYDLELSSMHMDLELKNILLSTEHRSILVVEDIDCSIDMQNQESEEQTEEPTTKLTLGLLNFIDGHYIREQVESRGIEVTWAGVAEELMKRDDADVALGGLVNFLKCKSVENEEGEKAKKTNV
ncbi:AAA-ATPase At3g50940-like [Pyrus communis]|uniref:AAA-ATPase At3g50940-like n=1 Tax=Pyrus communis TaxID=23211 RepID=UPI0035C12234